MQISSQMANAKTLWTRHRRLSQCDPGPEGDMAGAPLSYSPVFSLRGEPAPRKVLPRSWMELLISAAKAEVTDGFCTLGQRRGGRWVGGGWHSEAPGTRPSAWLRWSARAPPALPELPPSQEASARGGSPSLCAEHGQAAGATGRRLWSQAAPRSQSLGPRAPRRRRRFCAASAAGSSTGLCCARDGAACSRTGRCCPWNGPTPGTAAPRCRSWNLEQARSSSAPEGSTACAFLPPGHLREPLCARPGNTAATGEPVPTRQFRSTGYVTLGLLLNPSGLSFLICKKELGRVPDP